MFNDDDDPGFFSNLLLLSGLGVGGWLLYKTISGRAAAATVPGDLYAPTLPGPPLNVTPAGDPSAPRGIRNNNPGNIKWSAANNWDGQVGQDGDGFSIFSDPVYGLRAMFKLLQSYASSMPGPPAVFDIISINARWTSGDAAANQGAWISAVEAVSGLQRTQSIDVRDQGQMQRLVDGIVAAENGHPFIGYYASIEPQAWALAA